MIKFPCHCGHPFELADEMAGGMIQCPACGRLNDVPTLGDLPSLSPDGTLNLLPPVVEEEPQRIDELRLAFGKESVDHKGEEIDLRPDQEVLSLVDDAPVAGEPVTVRPKYDPMSGELIRPIEVKPDDPLLQQNIPLAKAVIPYASGPDSHRVTPLGIAIELFMPVNLAVMFVILVGHMLFEFLRFFAIVIAMNFALDLSWLSLPIIPFVLAHFANVIEEIGVETRDELPRPLRDLSFHEDIFGPFSRMVTAFAYCFWPLGLMLAIAQAPSAPALLAVYLLGCIFLPAAVLISTTSQSAVNLRPDRLLGTMRTCGGRYVVAVILGAAAVGAYAWAIAGLFLLPSSLRNERWALAMNHPAVVYPMLLAAIYLMHAWCWLLGILYRAHHDDFPWLFQRHHRVARRRKMTTIAPPAPKPIAPLAGRMPSKPPQP
ncbi:MAG TPA: hypothetical protein VIL86_19170 [Tepidisphaeraceae bacterium]|jgi:hypothetical protein